MGNSPRHFTRAFQPQRRSPLSDESAPPRRGEISPLLPGEKSCSRKVETLQVVARRSEPCGHVYRLSHQGRYRFFAYSFDRIGILQVFRLSRLQIVVLHILHRSSQSLVLYSNFNDRFLSRIISSSLFPFDKVETNRRHVENIILTLPRTLLLNFHNYTMSDL